MFFGHPCGSDSLHCSIPGTSRASGTPCTSVLPVSSLTSPHQHVLAWSPELLLKPSRGAKAMNPPVQGPEQGLGSFAQVWVASCPDPVVDSHSHPWGSVEPLHPQAWAGQGRDVLVRGGGTGLSLSLAGWLTEAIVAQILSPCPVLPLPWAAATLPTPLVVVV